MLNKQSILKALSNNKSHLEKLGVEKIGLFGSYVRESQKEDSDIDILLEFRKGSKTFDNFMDTCFFLEELFAGKKVEVVTIGGLSKYIGPYILNEVEYV